MDFNLILYQYIQHQLQTNLKFNRIHLRIDFMFFLNIIDYRLYNYNAYDLQSISKACQHTSNCGIYLMSGNLFQWQRLISCSGGFFIQFFFFQGGPPIFRRLPFFSHGFKGCRMSPHLQTYFRGLHGTPLFQISGSVTKLSAARPL